MFVDRATEQTTSITDLILALQAFAAIVRINRSQVRRPMWTDVWTLFFGLQETFNSRNPFKEIIKFVRSIRSVVASLDID